MEITQEIRKYAVDHLGVAKGATDEDIRKAVSDAIAKGDLSIDKLKELTTAKATEAEKKIRGMVTEEVTKAMDPLSAKLDALAEAMKPTEQKKDLDETAETITKAVEDDIQKAAATTGSGTPDDVAQKAMATAAMDAEKKETQVRLKSVAEQFDDTRTAATWNKSSKDHLRESFGHMQLKTATEGPGCRPLDMPSERMLAISGAWMRKMTADAWKRAQGSVPRQFQMREIDKKLCEYAAHECKFVGPMDWDEFQNDARTWLDPHGQKLSDVQTKALLDDSSSGGLEAVPIEFDAIAVLTPLLQGELFPYVSIRNVTRRRIEGFTVGNPTVAWGASEGSSISLLDTDSLISNLDTTIYPVTGAIEIGLDFESDSPVGIGNILVQNYGNSFRQEMDNIIANGSGTSRPTGIYQTSGLTQITPTSAGSAATVTDYEGLLFGVGKEFRQEARAAGADRTCFIGTDTSYQRCRSIVVSGTDQRRVFGMETNTHESYRILGHRYAVVTTSGLSNAQLVFACLNRFRLYRRQGLEVRVVTEDKELARKNQRMIIVRARYGGQLDHSSAATYISNSQA